MHGLKSAILAIFALLVQPSISAHRKWKWSTFCGSYEFLPCLECWIISAYSFGVGSGIKTVCHGFMPPQLKTNFLNYKFFEQILNSWPMCGTAVGGQAAAKKWTESGEMYKKATVLLYTRLHWTATIKVNTVIRLQAKLWLWLISVPTKKATKRSSNTLFLWTDVG